jgi:hypothetical protein
MHERWVEVFFALEDCESDMKRTKSFFDLRDALAEPGCAVCRLNADTADRFLDSLLWESVNDPGIRRDIRQSQGFCRQHAWELIRDGSSLGVAILMHDLFKNLHRTIENARYQGVSALSVRRTQEALNRQLPSVATEELVTQLSPQKACPACAQVSKMESIYLTTLLDHLGARGGSDSLLPGFEASDGLCLPHFRQALTLVRGGKSFERLMVVQRSVWQRLVGELSENIRKSDYRFRDEPRGDETDAWLRAVAVLVGARPDRPKK